MVDLILVTRVVDLPEPHTPAERSACSRCGEAVWLGYAVRIDAPFGTPVCLPCAAPELAGGEPLSVGEHTRREILDWMQRRRLDRSVE